MAGVPAGAVEHHERVDVSGQNAREPVQEQAHCLGRDFGQHQAEILSGDGFDGGEHVGEGVSLIHQAGRAQAAQPPAMTCAPFLADPGFILEVERDPLGGVRTGGGLQRRGQHVF